MSNGDTSASEEMNLAGNQFNGAAAVQTGDGAAAFAGPDRVEEGSKRGRFRVGLGSVWDRKGTGLGPVFRCVPSARSAEAPAGPRVAAGGARPKLFSAARAAGCML